MKLTTKGRYAVSAMADMAAIAGQGTPRDLAKSDHAPIPLSDIALRQGITIAYLEQLFSKLRRGGLVRSVRGVNGGYVLAREPQQIRVADIVAAVDEPLKTTACEPGRKTGCQGTTVRCLTHDLWDELGRQIELFLNAVTLEDVIAKRVLGMAAINVPDRGTRAGNIPGEGAGTVNA